MAANTVVVGGQQTIRSHQLRRGMLVRDNDGDIHIVTEAGSLVELASGMIFSDTQNYEPFTVLHEVTVTSS